MSVQHILLALVLRQICDYYSSQNLKVESSGKILHVWRYFFSYKPLSAWQLSYSREIEAEQEPRLLTDREKEKRK